ncbi:hypothetical protein FRC16_011366 [Serendipita sp. 398]|nr:hypothetical protein FRC16_011366 [Serendipita sp. 398]
MELLLQIISYIHDNKDLRSLALVSRTFWKIIGPEIWQVVDLGTTKWRPFHPRANYSRLMKLYNTMKNLRVGSYITVFRISIKNIYHCSYCTDAYGGNLRALYVRLVDPCRCKKLDRQLGAVIAELPNLHVLSMSCRLIHREGEERHAWLANLKTQVLQELELGCGYAPWKVKDYNLLLAPCMSKLSAVKLDAYFPFLDSELQYFMPLREQFFPLLDTLAYHISDGSLLRDWILSHRPIKNLVCLTYDPASAAWVPRFSRTLNGSSCHLEVFYAPGISSWLSSQDLSPYLKLRSLGTFNVNMHATESALLTTLAPLSSLTNLELLEFGFLRGSLPIHWSGTFFAGLELQIPSLKRIYLATRPTDTIPLGLSAFMYERTENSVWKHRPVRHLTYWQIATGASYNFDSKDVGSV